MGRTFSGVNYTILQKLLLDVAQIGRGRMTTQSHEQTDELLVEAAQNGHLEGFAALYQRYYSPMVALAYSMLADRDSADDVAQDVFAIACRDLASLRHTDKFAAWLAGICRNVARQTLRSKDRAVALSCEPGAESTDRHVPDWDAVRQAVWQLPSAERELVVLRYYDGFSQARISEVLDISPSAVNGRLVRAKRKLAKYLKRNGFAGDDHETG
ncbi:MAG: RNA polymerase sigma factor [Phycisphaerales bacterium]|nr:MAG: RNA polymerase sigma factor [Phycisphaerales bacterium]